jgi:hypothetical protein
MSNDLNRNEKILIEEIKIIQDIIKRMADNSFKIKAWAITVVVATLLIKTNLNNGYIALIPLLTFWFLDAYYLQQEKIFREIYKDKVENKSNNEETMFKINTIPYKCKVPFIFTIMIWNKSITPLYLTIFILLINLAMNLNLFDFIKCLKNCLGE